jgi:hypothetical protein
MQGSCLKTTALFNRDQLLKLETVKSTLPSRWIEKRSAFSGQTPIPAHL